MMRPGQISAFSQQQNTKMNFTKMPLILLLGSGGADLEARMAEVRLKVLQSQEKRDSGPN